MIKVYDMASGDLLPADSDENYGDEMLQVVTRMQEIPVPQLRLEVVTQESPVKLCLPDDLANVDCESFISSQTAK